MSDRVQQLVPCDLGRHDRPIAWLRAAGRLELVDAESGLHLLAGAEGEESLGAPKHIGTVSTLAVQ